jgi:hypothetical protein
VSRMCTTRPWGARRLPRTRRTTRSREGDKWRQLGGQRRPDAAHALEFVQRSKRPVGLAVRHDAGGQRRPDPRQAIEFLGGGQVEIHGCAQRAAGRGGRRGCHGWIGCGRLRTRARGCLCGCTPRPTPRCDGRIDGSDLGREGRPISGGHRRRRQRAAAAHTEPERGHRRHEEQGAALGGSRHAPRCRPRAAPTPPFLRARHRRSRSTVMATSPTICSVASASLSAVSSGV